LSIESKIVIPAGF